MHKITDGNTKSINEIYIFINLMEDYLKNLEKRITILEENEVYDGNYDR